MPYTAAHKPRTRERILDSARRLFTRSGYAGVTIDAVMAHAGLTRGGFYSHFANKAELFAAAVDSYPEITPWRAREGEASPSSAQDLARWFVDFYLSDRMLAQRELHCPLFALPGDVSRAGAAPQAAYTQLIERTRLGVPRRPAPRPGPRGGGAGDRLPVRRRHAAGQHHRRRGPARLAQTVRASAGVGVAGGLRADGGS